MSEDNKKQVIIYDRSATMIWLTQAADWVLFAVMFHLNYHLWQSLVIDVFIVMLGMSFIYKFLSPLKMTHDEAVEYFKKYEKENKC